ncbi:MAG: Steroid C27-monooxygenase [Acidimicrobiales bacterium]|jgi:cholest-4-en-3-one 26-monooxygenase|nr:Steroid C27-monooxygenase [Acidimicrobiales bacterium]
MELTDIDLLDRDVFTHGIPHDWFTYLRQHAPVYRHPEPDGPGFWVVTKYADVVTVGRDAHTYSSDSDRGGVIGLEDQQIEADFGDAKIMLMMDPPQHTRQRKLVNRGFTPRMINALEKHIHDLAVDILEQSIAKGTCDFVVDIAAELPLLVIAELIGVPVDDRHKIFDWSNRMVGSEDPEYSVSDDQANDARMEMFLYANQLAAQRRDDPHDDIITALLGAEVDGDQLTEMEFNLFFMLLSVAGNETTRNAIAHGLNAFLEHPDQYAKLVADPEGRIAGATEEILRWASPVMYFRRNVTQDTELGGQALATGDKVSIWYVSANRDEDVFDDPFRFDIERSPNDHVAFGGGGPHFCLGSSLARMEIHVLFEELARRVPQLHAVGDAQALRSNFIGGIKHLPVALQPA